MTSQIDTTKPIFGTPTTQSVRDNFTTAANEISVLQEQVSGSPFLPIAGGRMTGAMYLFNDPTDAMMPATKGYVDAQTGTGGGGIPEAPSDGTYYGRHSGAWVNVLPLVGGTLTGALILAADPTNVLGAVTKQYADAIAASHLTDAPNDANAYGRHANAWTGVLPITGGQLTGSVSVGPTIPPNLNTATPSLLASYFNILTTNGAFTGNGFVDNGTTPAWRYGVAGQAFQLVAFGTGQMALVVAPPGAANAAITFGPPVLIDYKGDLQLSGAPTIPTDVLAPTVSSPEYVAKLGGHYAINAYLAAPANWKYLAAGYAMLSYIDPANGNYTVSLYPSGSPGGAFPAATAFFTLTNGGIFNIQSLQVASNANVAGIITCNSVYVGEPAATDFNLGTGGNIRALAWRGGVYALQLDNSTGILSVIGNSNQIATFDYTGNFVIVGNATKPGGGPWTASSDDRVKRNVMEYATGLAEVTKLAPISFQYNGEGGTRDDGVTYYGLSAQTTQPIMPELVVELPALHADGSRNADMLDGQLGTQLGPLSLAFINSLKEIDARLRAGGL